GSLDVIAAIHTLAIKIQASGQCIEYFHSTQISCGLPEALKIPLHSNIRWGTAYKMLDQANKLRQQYFSSEKQPTLWRALPALEELQSAWEKKSESARYILYKDPLTDGLAKLGKYYSQLDEKPSFILALMLHPYYKLAYIKLAWGGPEEQAAEKAAGNADTKDWQDEAKQIVEQNKDAEDAIKLSEFDKHQETLLSDDAEEGWASELRRYLGTMQCNVKKDTDLIKWWQDHEQLFPTLVCVALDVLPAQALSVPCPIVFEELVFEEIPYFDFEELLIEEMGNAAWDKESVQLEDTYEFQN
ncbi:hypothetical protein CVT25_000097, partial [Psilocybe cyanescens]